MGIKAPQKLLQHQNTRSSVHKQIPRARDGGLRQDGIGRAGIVLSDIIIFLMVAGLIGGLIYVMASPNRYAKMTAEEFEEDPKRSSVPGSVVVGMERALRRREADLVIEEKLRVEKDATPSGDRPPQETPEPTKEKPRS
jgi:hypothetical protein